MFGPVLISIALPIFVTILFGGFVAVSRMLLGQERSYSKLSKTAPIAIISPMVLDKGIFKVKNKNPKRT